MRLGLYLPRKQLLALVQEVFPNAKRHNTSNTIVVVESESVPEGFIKIQLTCGFTPWLRIYKGNYVNLYQNSSTKQMTWHKLDEVPRGYSDEIPVETTEDVFNILVYVKTNLGI